MFGQYDQVLGADPVVDLILRTLRAVLPLAHDEVDARRRCDDSLGSLEVIISKHIAHMAALPNRNGANMSDVPATACNDDGASSRAADGAANWEGQADITQYAHASRLMHMTRRAGTYQKSVEEEE